MSPNGPPRPPPYFIGPRNHNGPPTGGHSSRYVEKEKFTRSYEDDRPHPWKPGKTGRRPVYPAVHRDFLSLETLAYYDIPYEMDRYDPNRIIILREMDKYETEVLFEHTRRLRGGLPRRRSSYDDTGGYNLRSESHGYGSPFVVNTYHEGTSSGYDEVGSRTRDRSSGYQPSSSISYKPSTSDSYRRAPYVPPSAADPSRNPYAEHEYDGLHTFHSMNRRRSPSPSAYTDGRRSQPYSQRSYGANDVHTEVGSAFPDKQLIVRESDSAERWNPRQSSRDDGLGEEVSDDSMSDVYPDEEDSEDSSTESSESDEESDRQHGPATSGGTSDLGFDRTLTDSPVSISSRDSHQDEHLDAGPLPASRSGPGNLRRMTGSVSSSGARGAGSGVEAEHVDDLARTLDAVAPFPGSGDAEHASQP
ncbi:hypothetical protein KC352_g31453 [Hortaea werneckii]|nr:hypothetical protein KC352_g31453 [Hortaea werneckii]